MNVRNGTLKLASLLARNPMAWIVQRHEVRKARGAQPLMAIITAKCLLDSSNEQSTVAFLDFHQALSTS